MIRKTDLQVEFVYDPVPDAQERLLKIFEFLLQEDDDQNNPDFVLPAMTKEKVFANSGPAVYNAAQKEAAV